MNKTTVKFKKLDERAQMPHYGTEFAAGADLYACLDAPLTIAKGATEFVHTGDCDGNSYRTCRTCVCKKRAGV